MGVYQKVNGGLVQSQVTAIADVTDAVDLRSDLVAASSVAGHTVQGNADAAVELAESALTTVATMREKVAATDSTISSINAVKTQVDSNVSAVNTTIASVTQRVSQINTAVSTANSTSAAATTTANGKAPRPQVAAGLGQWVSRTDGKLPSGGTWAYFGLSFGYTSGRLTSIGQSAGVAAGGTNIGRSHMFAWRVS